MRNFHQLEVVGHGSVVDQNATQCEKLLYAVYGSKSSGFGSRSRRFERNKNVSSPSTCESQYCGASVTER